MTVSAQSYAKLYGKRIFFDTDRKRIDLLDGMESRMNGRTEAERMAAEHEAANPPMRLTDAEREAITVACGDSSQWGRPHVATLMRLLERTR